MGKELQISVEFNWVISLENTGFTEVKAKLPFRLNHCGQPTGNIMALKVLFFGTQQYTSTWNTGINVSSIYINSLLKASPFVKVKKENLSLCFFVFLL